MGWREDLKYYMKEYSNGWTSGGYDIVSRRTSEESMATYGRSGKKAYAAYKNWSDSSADIDERDMTDAIMDNFCNAETFVNAMNHRADTKLTADTVNWLMEPCPDWWLRALSSDQYSSRMGKGWSAEYREKYEYPISRLEFWSVAWIRSAPGAEQEDNYMGLVALEGNWSEEIYQWNKTQYTAAWTIILWIWGRYWKKNGGVGKTADGSNVYSGGSGDNKWTGLYKKDTSKEDFTPAEVKFVEMLAINQGKGPAFIDWIGPGFQGDADYPWAVDEDLIAIKQWLFVGEEAYNDPVTHGILYKLLFTSGGYNTPFDPETMGFRERVAFAVRERVDSNGDGVITSDDRVTGEVNFTQAKKYLGQFTADTFLERTLKYIKSDDPHKIWDGVLTDDPNRGSRVDRKIRTGVVEESIFNNDPSGPGHMAKAPYAWDSRRPNKDDEDWDTGLFCWLDSNSKQFGRIGDTNNSERDGDVVGAGRLMYYLLPKADWDNHWLKGPDGSININNELWKEHREFLLSLINVDFGFIQTYDMNSGQTIQRGGSAKYKTNLSGINDSGFFDWESMVKDGKLTNVWLTSEGRGELSTSNQQGIIRSMLTFIPDQVIINNQTTDTSALTMDFVKDVNALKPGTLKGTRFEFEAAVDSEAAKNAVSGIKDMFLKFAGSKENGRGPTESQATAEWFTTNFPSNQLVPNDNDEFFAKIDLNNLPEDVRGSVTKLLDDSGFGLNSSIITFNKSNSPWEVPYYSRTKEVPFEQILRTYQAAAYMAMLYYRDARKNVDNVAVLLQDIWDHYAFKCAYHFYRIWEKLLHDHQVGNLYALICIVLSKTDFQSDEALKALEALADLLKASDNNLMEQIGTTEAPPQVEENPDPEANKEQRERFYKQCALLLNMDKLQFKYNRSGVMHEKSNDAGFTSYNGRIHMVTDNGESNGQKNTILNKLVTPNPTQMARFTEMRPEVAARLQPYIRFFRVWQEDEKLKEIEFEFPKVLENDKNGIPRIERPSDFDRGDGMGLEEFTWETDGETPATASKYIAATCTLHFQTFNDFIRVRKNKKGLEYRWVDMFVSPTTVVARGGPTANTPHTLKYDSEYYRIRVDVGYHTDDGIGDVLSTQNRSFFLVLVDNEITINEDMSVTIKANYRAYIEEAMDSNKFNALSTPELRNKMEEQKKEWDKATKAWKEGNCNDRNLRFIRNSINVEMEEIIKKQHKSIMKNMLELGRIFYVDFKPTHIANFRQNGIFDAIPTYADSESHHLKPDEDAAERLRKLMEAKDDPKREPWQESNQPHMDERVYYFYFGDLIYLINSSMYKGNQPWKSSGLFNDKYAAGAENHKILLMDFDYHNTLAETANSRRTINIAHIPISVDFFFQWYVNNIIKNETYHIGVGAFIKRLLDELITEAMSEICMQSEEGHYVTFQHGSISVGGVGTSVPGQSEKVFTDPLTSMMLAKKDSDTGAIVFDCAQHYMQSGMGDLSLPLKFIPDQQTLKDFDLNGVQGQFQYVYIYGDTKDALHAGRGDRALDAARGCYHLNLAQDSGLVKSISFSKNNVPYLRESRMFNQGQAGLLQLSAVYDCQIEMIGNTLFLPGQEVWVNPYGFGGDEFGKPQDPPLNWSPTTAEINAVNDSIKDAKKDGTFSEDEMATVIDGIDSLNESVAQRSEGVNMKILSYANVMGIGGYQLIIRTKCTIKPGEFSTTINAKHTYSGYPSIKQSLNLAEFREGKPNEISNSSEEDDSSCRAILAVYEMSPP